ncbi:MAG: hypothetical protein IKU42_02990 [Oscillospiraceae bacterium]|nr:hypothetical protein [Oscillospiraceae bacterium]
MNISEHIADLSQIWKHVSVVFPYFDKAEIDWDKEYFEYIQKINDVKTEKEFHLLLAEFMNLLGDGHTDYIFPKELSDETGYLPFGLKYIGGEYYIDSIIPEHAEFLHSKVISINSVSFSDFLKKAFRYVYHIENFSPSYALNRILPFLLNKENNIMETSEGEFSFNLLQSKPAESKKSFLKSPKEYKNISNGKLDIRIYKNDILYIRLDNFMYEDAAKEIRNVFDNTKSPNGLILDLRENIGGMTMFGAKIAELLISGKFNSCKKRTRTITGIDYASASQLTNWSRETIEKELSSGFITAEELDESKKIISGTYYKEYEDIYGNENQKAIYTGPCIILTSRYTVSAAEDFVSMFRTNNRATIIGTETSGTTGTPFLKSLLCGGKIRICSVGYKLFDGTEFIRKGIKPDIFKEISPEDFKNGFDSVLDFGIDFLLKSER